MWYVSGDQKLNVWLLCSFYWENTFDQVLVRVARAFLSLECAHVMKHSSLHNDEEALQPRRFFLQAHSGLLPATKAFSENRRGAFPLSATGTRPFLWTSAAPSTFVISKSLRKQQGKTQHEEQQTEKKWRKQFAHVHCFKVRSAKLLLHFIDTLWRNVKTSINPQIFSKSFKISITS